MIYFTYVLLGLCAGLVSGAFGVGGGTILVPALALFYGLSQHQAQGTALAIMLPPVFLFAAWKYYQHGHVNVPLAVMAAIGLTCGAFIGAYLSQSIPDASLRKAFGLLLILIGIKMAFFR